jgi:hypothetical protein
MRPIFDWADADGPQHSRNAADVILVIVADEEIRQVGNAQLFVIRDRLIALLMNEVFPNIEGDDLAAGRNEQGTVALANINEMKLEFPITLTEE